MSAGMVPRWPENVDEFGIGCVLSRAHPGSRLREMAGPKVCRGAEVLSGCFEGEEAPGPHRVRPRNAWRPMGSGLDLHSLPVGVPNWPEGGWIRLQAG